MWLETAFNRMRHWLPLLLNLVIDPRLSSSTLSTQKCFLLDLLSLSLKTTGLHYNSSNLPFFNCNIPLLYPSVEDHEQYFSVIPLPKVKCKC